MSSDSYMLSIFSFLLYAIHTSIKFLRYIDFIWRRKWQPTPVFLPGESYGQRRLAPDYSAWVCKEPDTTEATQQDFIMYFWLRRVFVAAWAFLSLWQAKLLSGCHAWPSHCCGFSCCGARALGSWAAVAADPVHRLAGCGTRLSCSTAPGQGTEPMSCALEGRLFITEPPGKPSVKFSIQQIYECATWQSPPLFSAPATQLSPLRQPTHENVQFMKMSVIVNLTLQLFCVHVRSPHSNPCRGLNGDPQTDVLTF